MTQKFSRLNKKAGNFKWVKKSLFLIVPLLLWGCRQNTSESAAAPSLLPKKETAHTVRFITNENGAEFTNFLVLHGKAVKKPATDPTRADKFFAGWFTTAATRVEFDFDAVRITSNTTVYAGWSDKGITVTFKVGGGSAVAEQRIIFGGKATRPTTDPTSNGYAFIGWYKENTFATPFNFEAALTTNTIVYARWLQTFTVSFATNQGGAVAVWTEASQSVRKGSNATKPNPDPTYVGRNFKGWFTTAATKVKFDFDAVRITSNTTVYAAWELKTYAVAFWVNGGSEVGQQTIAHGGQVVPPPSPTWAGHTFGGWFKERSFTNAFNFATAVTNRLTLYAQWRLTHSVTAVLAVYPTNFYGDKTQPTLSWTVAPGSAAARQELRWGEAKAGSAPVGLVARLSANANRYTIPLTHLAAINGEKTYHLRLDGVNSNNTITNASRGYAITLHSCAAPQGGFTMVCSPATLEGINTKQVEGAKPKGNYKLQNKLDLGGKQYDRALLGSFGGVLNGNGKVITNGKIDAPRSLRVGLIGQLENGGVISNLGVALEVQGSAQVGGVVGMNHGTISRVYFRGAVSGTNSVGGVVGWNLGSLVSRVHASGTVSGVASVGGVVGFNQGPLTDVYSTGTVSGHELVGGVVGTAAGGGDELVSNAYTTATVRRSGGTANTFGRVIGFLQFSPATTNLYYRSTAGFPTEAPAPSDPGPGSPVAIDFSALSSAEVAAAQFFGFNFSSVWRWSATLRRPVLRQLAAGAEE